MASQDPTPSQDDTPSPQDPTLSQDDTPLAPVIRGATLYFSCHGLTLEVVSEFVKLKNNGIGPEPDVVPVMQDAFKQDFKNRRIQWKLETIGEEIARLMGRAKFRAFTDMDAACDAILDKCEAIHRAQLEATDEKNVVKAAALGYLEIYGQFPVDEEAPAQASPFKEYVKEPLLSALTLSPYKPES